MSGIWLGPAAFSTYDAGIEKEWLVGNGLGGYASSSVIAANSRTYHGLLIAALGTPAERVLLLSSLDEELAFEGEVYSLAAHKYPGTVYPTGFRYLKKFALAPLPFWLFQVEDFTVKKKVFMVYGKNTAVIQYEIKCKKSGASFKLFPLVNARSIHSTTRSSDLVFSEKCEKSGVNIQSSNGYSLWLVSNFNYHPDPRWYYNFEYDMEERRGLSYQEDNYNPGFFEIKLDKGISNLFVIASTEKIPARRVEEVEELYSRRVYRQNLLAFNSKLLDPFALKLLRASDSFIVLRQPGFLKSVIAGYHWFGDWGRDTMISLPGLVLVPRRFEDASGILSNFARYCRRGLIPNLFPSFGGEPKYNTVDASLWFIHALYRYFDYTLDIEFVLNLWETVEDILGNYMKGTDFGIGMASDGLVFQGPQLTWMDAKIGDYIVTPRAGKTCEINALWYDALKIASFFGELLEKDASRYDFLARKVALSFENLFWNPEENCLFDSVSEDEKGATLRDPAIRPNQILAVSLPFTMLSSEKEKAIVDRVKRDLLTPYGLRTLSQNHPEYRGQYRGDPENRDRAYHNGTVWPWLLGPYVSAYRKVNNYSKESREDMKALLLGFDLHLEDAGIGTISEVFDGDFPHVPGGCISQAWSVAEILRAYVEDVLGIKP